MGNGGGRAEDMAIRGPVSNDAAVTIAWEVIVIWRTQNSKIYVNAGRFRILVPGWSERFRVTPRMDNYSSSARSLSQDLSGSHVKSPELHLTSKRSTRASHW